MNTITKIKNIMKTKILLLLLTVFTINTNAQTFDWETGTLLSYSNPDVVAQQIVGGYEVNFSTAGTGTPILLGTFNQGTTGLAVMNQQPQQFVRLTFSPAVDIQSLKGFSANSNTTNWTFTPVNSPGNTVVTSNIAQNAVTVNLNWTNVSIIDISLTNGNSQNFGVDDIVFTPNVPCTVTIPDANFKAVLVGNTAINTNGDTEIQCSEATAFTGEIYAYNESISDLTGIEAFVNLTILYCGTNLLTSLDVSNNLALEELYCLSNNITNLDVSANTNLIRLNCHGNSLTDLNVANGNNSSFTYFYATNNPNLTCIQVDNVTYSTANWTNVDAQTSFSANCSGGLADTIYVNHTATGNNDGTTWADAYTSLHSALNTASSVDNIWVAKGTYKPHASDRDASFIVNNNLYGGFAGTEVSLSDRDISLIHTINATLLDGDLLSDDDTTVDFNDSTRGDNSKHVVEVATNNLEINGFTIQNGYADALSGDDRFGAGIFKETAVPNLTVKNCNIKNNVALAGAGLALTATSDSYITIDSCTIENNLANVASGLDYHLSGSSAQMNIVITNCLFNNNKTDDDVSKSRKGVGAAAARMRAQFGTVSLYAKLVNNTIVNNSCLGDVNASGVADFPVIDISIGSGAFGDIDVANNIFWGNVKHNATVPLAIGRSNGGNSSITSINASHRFVNNIDEEGFSSFSSTPQGTVTTNPLFTSTTDFTLQSGSPAVNEGSNLLLPSGITTDLLGNNRIVGTRVDRGAYEYSSTLGIEDNVLIGNFKLYPNPVRNTLNIQLEESIEKVEVFWLYVVYNG